MIECDLLMFDLDGTLVDSRKDICKCANFMLRTLGLAQRNEDEIISYVGNGAGELVAQILGEENTPKHSEAINIFRSYLAEDHEFETVLYDGVLDVLEHFSDKKLYVVTNRPYESAMSTLDRVGILDKFHHIYGGTENLTELKPNPWMIEQSLIKSGADRSRAIMVGDTEVDIAAAKNSSVVSCGAAYGFFGKDYLKQFSPDMMINTIRDLKDLIV